MATNPKVSGLKAPGFIPRGEAMPEFLTGEPFIAVLATLFQ